MFDYDVPFQHPLRCNAYVQLDLIWTDNSGGGLATDLHVYYGKVQAALAATVVMGKHSHVTLLQARA